AVGREGGEPPVWGPGAGLRVVGKPTDRVEARERATGVAEYAYDVRLPGMLTAAGLRSPHPHARVVRIDASRAEAAPGVRAVLHRFNVGDLSEPGRDRPIFAEELLHQGDLVALVIAERRDQAEAATRLVQVEYAPLPFVIDPEAALQPGAPHVRAEQERNTISDEYPVTYVRGDVEQGLAEAEVVIEVRFETPTALHNAMETHGGVARWDGRT